MTAVALKAFAKQASGAFSFISGGLVLLEAIASIRSEPAQGQPAYPRWLVIAAKISLICSALSSPWSVFLGGYLLSRFLPQYADVFGPNTTFAINPWHPRHVLSIAGAGLGAVVLIAGLWIVISRLRNEAPRGADQGTWAVGIAALNAIFSRPALHAGNWLLGRVVALRWA